MGEEAQTLGDSHSQMRRGTHDFDGHLVFKRENATTQLRKMVASGTKPARAGFVSFTVGRGGQDEGFVSSMGVYVF